MEERRRLHYLLYLFVVFSALSLVLVPYVFSQQPTDFDWGDTTWRHRIGLEITANANMTNWPVERDLNFTSILAAEGETAPFDNDSIRVYEFDSNGNRLYEVPSQFDEGDNYDSDTNAAGTVTFLLNGSTTEGTTRHFFIYFESEAHGKPPASYGTDLEFGESNDDVIHVNTSKFNYSLDTRRGENTSGIFRIIDRSLGGSTLEETDGTARTAEYTEFSNGTHDFTFNLSVNRTFRTGPLRVVLTQRGYQNFYTINNENRQFLVEKRYIFYNNSGEPEPSFLKVEQEITNVGGSSASITSTGAGALALDVNRTLSGTTPLNMQQKNETDPVSWAFSLDGGGNFFAGVINVNESVPNFLAINHPSRGRTGINMTQVTLQPDETITHTALVSTGFGSTARNQFQDMVTIFKNRPTINQFDTETINATVEADTNETIFNRNETILLTANITSDPYNLTDSVNATLDKNTSTTTDDSTIVLTENSTDFWIGTYKLNGTSNVGNWTLNVTVFTPEDVILGRGIHTFTVTDQYFANISLRNPVEVQGNVIFGNLTVQNIRRDKNISGANVTCNFDGSQVDPDNITEIQPGLYSLNFTAPSPPATYTLSCNATSNGNTGQDNETFRSEIAQVSPNTSAIPPSVDVDGVTLFEPANFTFLLNVSNNQTGTAHSTNVSLELPGGWVSNATNVSCGDLPPDSSCSRNVEVQVENNTSPSNFTVNLTTEWINPDGTTDINSTNLSVEVLKNPLLNVTERELNESMGGGQTRDIGNFTVESLGNFNLTNVTFQCESGEACNNFTVSFTPTNISSVGVGDNRSVRTTVEVPRSYPPGLYNGTVNVSSEKSFDTFNISIDVIGVTIVDTDTIPSSQIVADNVTLSGNQTLDFDTNSSNVGGTFAQAVNVSISIPSGWSTNRTNSTCGDLNASDSCLRDFFVTVPNATDPGNYIITATSEWINPDGTANTSSHDLTVNVEQNPVQRVRERFINGTVDAGANETVGNFTVESLGNFNLSSFNFTCEPGSGAVCDNLSVSFTPNSTNMEDVVPGDNRSVNVSVEVPQLFPAGSYNGTLNVSSSGGYDLLTINVSVPVTRAWTISQQQCTTSSDPEVGIACQPLVNNTGNVPISINITNVTARNSTLPEPDNFTVPFRGEFRFNMTYNVSSDPDSVHNATYNVSSFEDASPQWRELRVTVLPASAPSIQLNVTPQQLVQNVTVLFDANITSVSGFPLDSVDVNVTTPHGNSITADMRRIENETSTRSIWRLFYPNETGSSAANTTTKGTYTVNLTANDTLGNNGFTSSNFTVTAKLNVFLSTGTNEYIQGEEGSILYNLTDILGEGIGGAEVNLSVYDPEKFLIPLDTDNPLTTSSDRKEGYLNPKPKFDLPNDAIPGIYTLTANTSWNDPDTGITERRDTLATFEVEQEGTLDLDMDAGTVWFPSSNLTIWAAISDGGNLQDPDDMQLTILDPQLNIYNTSTMDDFTQEREGIFFHREMLPSNIEKGIYYAKLEVAESGSSTVEISSFRVSSKEISIGEFDIRPQIVNDTVPQGKHVNFNITIKNPELPSGDVKLEYWVSRNGERFSYTSEAIFIETNESLTVPRNLFIFNDQPTGTYFVNTRISRGGNSASGNATFRVVEGEEVNQTQEVITEEETRTERRPAEQLPREEEIVTNISIVSAPSEINLARSESHISSVTVGNIGDRVVGNISVSLVGVPPSWVSVSPQSIPSLSTDQSQTFNVAFDIPEDASLGEYNSTFLVTSDVASFQRSVRIEIFRSLEEKIRAEIERIENELVDIRARISSLDAQGADVSGANSLVTEIENELDSARTNLEQGNVDRALQNVNSADSLLRELKSVVNKIGPAGPGPLRGLLPLIIGAAILLVLVVVIVYLVKVRGVHPVEDTRRRIHEVMMEMKREEVEKREKLREEKRKTMRLLDLLEAQKKEDIIEDESYRELKSSAEKKLKKINNELKEIET